MPDSFGPPSPSRSPSAPPGTLVADPMAPAPRMEVIAYGPETITHKDVASVSELKPLLGEWPEVWVNIGGLGDAHTAQEIGDLFGLHPLALEDGLLDRTPRRRRPTTNPYSGPSP